MNYELLEQICSDSGKSRLKRFLVKKFSNLSINESILHSTLEGFIRPKSTKDFCRFSNNYFLHLSHNIIPFTFKERTKMF